MVGCAGPRERFSRLWRAFRSRFVTIDGRVVDVDNGGVSHSEGQGWGLSFALAGDDEETFRRIWTWTETTLRRRTDALFSWRYDPRSDPVVPDPNNASDGDIFIAWALARAARRFGAPEWEVEAGRIRAALLEHCTVAHGDDRYLLPGADGFRREEGLVLNPSYFVFPAFAAFARGEGRERWRQVDRTARTLLERARFGAFGLPADWVALNLATSEIAPASGFPPRFGFEAIRIPLYVAWRFGPTSPLLAPFAGYAAAQDKDGSVPAWQDLQSGEHAPYPLSAGARRVLALATGDTAAARNPDLPEDGYYGSALAFLAALAAAGEGRVGES